MAARPSGILQRRFAAPFGTLAVTSITIPRDEPARQRQQPPILLAPIAVLIDERRVYATKE
jgi:hypothetical protein